MNQLWTGLFELLTPPDESGNTGCFTNIVSWATDAEDFRLKVTQIMEKDYCFVVNVENCVTVSKDEDVPDELAGRLAEPGRIPTIASLGHFTTFLPSPLSLQRTS